jgi:hypothetical protein
MAEEELHCAQVAGLAINLGGLPPRLTPALRQETLTLELHCIKAK